MSANDSLPLSKLMMSDDTKRILLKPKRAFELLDISRSTGYALIASGELPSIRIGRAVRIPVDALKHWVEQQTNKEDKE